MALKKKKSLSKSHNKHSIHVKNLIVTNLFIFNDRARISLNYTWGKSRRFSKLNIN